jgi:hypothetical protein
MSIPNDVDHRPHPSTPRPIDPYLCALGDQIPHGWQRTKPAPQSTTCLAFDPRRHTVVHSFEGQPDDRLAEITAKAGFQRFEVPGSPAGFFARDRSTAQQRSPGAQRMEPGMSR